MPNTVLLLFPEQILYYRVRRTYENKVSGLLGVGLHGRSSPSSTMSSCLRRACNALEPLEDMENPQTCHGQPAMNHKPVHAACSHGSSQNPGAQGDAG